MGGAKRYEDLIVWQLADRIRVLAFKLTERDCFVRDLKLHSQTEDAVNSVCRNIAEGFGCKHKEFARFLEISRRSLNEVRLVPHRAIETVRHRARIRAYLAAGASPLSRVRGTDLLPPNDGGSRVD